MLYEVITPLAVTPLGASTYQLAKSYQSSKLTYAGEARPDLEAQPQRAASSRYPRVITSYSIHYTKLYEALIQDLAGRMPFIDGVVISGGEPTLDPTLPDFLAALKALGLAVKLDTNGLSPGTIADLLDRQLIDYLAIDLKTTPARYPELHPGPVNPADLLATVQLTLAAPVAVEFRTTCIPALVDEAVIHALGEVIRGVPLWALQQYHPARALDPAWSESLV